MSVFQVSDEHIDAVLSYFCQNNLKMDIHGDIYDGSDIDDLAELGQLIFKTNLASFNVRYPNETTGGLYKYKGGGSQNLSHMEIAKLCDCIVYQCSELPNYQAYVAVIFCVNIKMIAICNINEYQTAKWSI